MLLSDWMAALVGAAALLAIVPLGLALAINGLLRLRSLRRRSAAGDPRGEAERWEDHALAAQWLVWIALAVGLPASYAFAYLNGASLFCF